MSRQRFIQLLAIVLTLVFLTGSFFILEPIRHQRKTLQYDMGELPVSARGQAVVTQIAATALGSFRGLLADILWIRCDKLKQEGKFFEINTLSEWITTLQPSFTKVWAYHAWNMGYNVSVATYTREERWDWVNKCVRLLREKAIPLNPRAVELYKELGYHFFFKIGGYMDDMHWYYKQRMAQEWQEILGAPVESNDIQKVVEPYRAIVAAPDSLGQLKADQPQTAKLLEELAVLGYDPDQTLLRQLGKLQMFASSPDVAALGLSVQQLPREVDVRLVEVLAKPANAQALPSLLAFLRKKVLKNDYYMDPEIMLLLMTPESEEGYGFGPLDWRHPVVHALYWNTLGTRVSMNAKGKEKVDLLNTYRGVIHSLQSLTDWGRINYDPLTKDLDLLPDPRYIPAYDKAWEIAIKDLRERQYSGNPERSYQAGHENFLVKAVHYSYLYGSVDEAHGYYQRLRQLYGNTPERVLDGKYLQPIDELVYAEVSENFDTLANVRQFIDAMLVQGISQGLVNNRPEIFERCLKLAKMAYDKNNARTVATPNADQRRMGFLPFDQMIASTYIGLLRSPLTSPDEILRRARAWRNTPPALQGRVYLTLRPVLEFQCQELNQTYNMGLDVNKVFPQPLGVTLTPAVKPETNNNPAQPQRQY